MQRLAAVSLLSLPSPPLAAVYRPAAAGAVSADDAALQLLRYTDALAEAPQQQQADQMEHDLQQQSQQQRASSAAVLSRALVEAAAACEGVSWCQRSHRAACKSRRPAH
jgi:hypothetical protein